MPSARFHIDGVTKQIGQSLYHGETKAQPLAALARRIVDLVKLLEDLQTIFLRHSRARIPHLDTHHLAATAAPQQHLAMRRKFHGVGEQVARICSRSLGSLRTTQALGTMRQSRPCARM